jgi:hypothetical protein
MELTAGGSRRRLTSIMAPTYQRHFIQQTSIAAAALYSCPFQALAGAREILPARKQSAAPVDPAESRSVVGEGLSGIDYC